MIRRILVCCTAAALLVGCSSEEKKNAGPRPVRAALVTVASSEVKDVPHIIDAVAMVNPSASVNIVSRTSGQLQQCLVKDGDFVKKGQLLFVIEKTPYEISLQQAQARLESDQAKLAKARDDYARAQKMNKGGFSSAAETDASRVAMVSAQAAVREDEAAIEKAKLDLSYCEVRSPMDGRAGSVRVDLGNIVSPQTSLLVVDALDPAEMVFNVPEKHLPLIRRNFDTEGLPVSAVTKEGKKLVGMVTFIGNVDSSTGTVPLTAEFANEGFPLWPGEYMTVELQLDTRRGVVTVPNRAVMLGPDGPFVYVVDAQKTAHMRLVKTDLETRTVTIVSEGLEKGENVVLEGHVRLKNGVPVRIAGEEAKAGQK